MNFSRLTQARFFRIFYNVWNVGYSPEERLSFWANHQDLCSPILGFADSDQGKLIQIEDLYYSTQNHSGSCDHIRQNILVDNFYHENGVTLREIRFLLHFWEFTPRWQQFREDYPNIALLPLMDRLCCYEQRFILAEAELSVA